MDNKSDQHVIEFIIALMLILFVIPASTFSVRKKFPFRGVEARWAALTGVSGSLLMMAKYFIKHLEVFPFDISEKKFLFCISIVSVNLILTSALLVTESWWKSFEYIREGMTEQCDI